jgi:drug/metabolite transporter (DMT)-like permease
MLWLVYVLLSIVSVSSYAILATILLRKKGDALAFTLFLDFFACIFIFIYSILFERVTFQLSAVSVTVIILLTLLYALDDYLIVKSRTLEDASTIALLSRVGPIIPFIGGVIIFHEQVTLIKIIAIVLILCGSTWMICKGQHLTLRYGVKLILIGSLLFNFGVLIDKYMIGQVMPPGYYKSIVLLLISFWLAVYMKHPISRVTKEIRLRGPLIFLAGFLIASYTLFLNKSFQVGEISKIMPIYNSNFLLTVLGGVVLLNERTDLKKKFIGSLITLVGVIMLTLP